MTRRIIGLAVAAILIVALAYVSRFWAVPLWGREGLFGLGWLKPGGDLWRGWMRELGLGPYDLILWAVGAFFVLSVAQKIWDRVFRG